MRTVPDTDVMKARKRVSAKERWYKPDETDAKDLPVISSEDIKKFKDQPVIVLDGYLVDVGHFYSKHPGGEDVLRRGFGGRNLSRPFLILNRHSEHARGLVQDMRIARISEGKNQCTA